MAGNGGELRVRDLRTGTETILVGSSFELPGSGSSYGPFFTTLTHPVFSPDGSRVFFTGVTIDEDGVEGHAWVVPSEEGPARPLHEVTQPHEPLRLVPRTMAVLEEA